ncbi:MAG: FAD-binding protein [Spirochaetaceae bacterium]|nr:FAD-binding protein [Spirochaetaceae bacterium]
MICDVSLDLLPGTAPAANIDDGVLRDAVAARLSVSAGDVRGVVIRKKSVDARRRQIKLHLCIRAYVNQDPPASDTSGHPLPVWQHADPTRRVQILGAGPAGLFAALRLLETGITPVIFERGKPCPERRRDIARISRGEPINGDSNYCFGEGGAGAFSDGKLQTRSTKRGDVYRILRILCHFGADPSILTDAHPHVGSDRLSAIVGAVTSFIREMGGEVRFDMRLEGLDTKPARDAVALRALRVRDIASGSLETVPCEGLILAAGHSSPEIYRLLAGASPSSVAAKPFAVGVRVEHPREIIDAIQYRRGREEDTERIAALGAAEYRLTAQADGRGVYTFCMCPGGFIVPSASGEESLVMNGMSAAGRNSAWSNAALVVETRLEDLPGDDPLAGLRFRETLEYAAWEAARKAGGIGQQAPAQRLVDFMVGRPSSSLPRSSYAPGLVPSRLDQWLPESLVKRLRTAVATDFSRKMPGFLCDDAVLVAPETRTSTPVRILRTDGESPTIRGLFPAGEGSGYSGGIVSSAMDGEHAADAIGLLKKSICP